MRITNSGGFTLVEVLIVSPFVVLIIGVFIGLAVTATGESLRVSERNAMVFDTQSALDIIEDDAYRASAFLFSNADFTTPNTATSPSALIIRGAATTTNPMSATRRLAYIVLNTEQCTMSNLETKPYLGLTYVYYTKNNTLYRRTSVDAVPSGSKLCPSDPWQRTSCDPDSSSCTNKDVALLSNLSSMQLSFYRNAADTNETSSNWGSNSPSTVSVRLNVSNTVAGETILNSESIRVSSVNIK